MSLRVEESTKKLLALLESESVCGTFFVLGWVADRFPELVRRIHECGHEVASHGYWHHLIYEQEPEEFRQDLCSSRDAIANACGVEVTAYRAPSFSITKRSFWAIEILVECGFSVDSSVFPIAGHDRYGVPGAKKEIHELVTTKGNIIEFPPSAWHIGKFNIPIEAAIFEFSLGLCRGKQSSNLGRELEPRCSISIRGKLTPVSLGFAASAGKAN